MRKDSYEEIILTNNEDKKESKFMDFQKQFLRQQNAELKLNKNMIDRKVEIIDDKIISANWKLTETHIYTIRTFKIGNSQQQIEETLVERRFSDFEWLHNILITKYLGLIIPPHPEKSALVKLTKVNEMQGSKQFLENRKKQLLIFLQKLLKHNEVRFAPVLWLFIFEGYEDFQITKQNLKIEGKSGNEGGTVWGNLTKYILSFNPLSTQKAVQYSVAMDSDYEYFEDYEKIFIISEQKLKDIVNCVHVVFQNKKEQARIFLEMSEIFGKLSAEDALVNSRTISHNMQITTKQTGEQQDKLIDELIDNVEIILKEELRHLISCLELFEVRKQLLVQIQQNEKYIAQARQSGATEEIQKILDNSMKIKDKFEQLTQNLKNELEQFKQQFNKNINETLKCFMEVEYNLCLKLQEIWKHQA